MWFCLWCNRARRPQLLLFSKTFEQKLLTVKTTHRNETTFAKIKTRKNVAKNLVGSRNQGSRLFQAFRASAPYSARKSAHFQGLCSASHTLSNVRQYTRPNQQILNCKQLVLALHVGSIPATSRVIVDVCCLWVIVHVPTFIFLVCLRWPVI